ncbi:hypothetical protein MLC59_07560 [Marinobacter bryozoorum]|uniref:hypothetical protein n=1 Tax=Marinobacter bryozoorum TaxID=256324 RepID=UPI002003CB21|nr:hypothetical protein [Marinobacter bryozoorum]MCK7544022.1 hypothetical protein [Marinobacter bryozoorum]
MDVAFYKLSATAVVVPLMLAVVTSASARAEDISYTATTTVFTDVTHTERDSRNDTRGGAGISGDVGANWLSGAHQFNALYGGTLETERSSLATGDRDNLSVRGSSRYNFYQPGGRFDFNAGHTIRSVRNDTGFTLDESAYDTQNAVNAGAGVMFYPGELTTLRLGGQAAKTWAEDDVQDGESQSVEANLSRQLSERSTLSLTGRRAWEHEEDLDITLDSASVGLNTLLENGSFSASVGASRAESDDFENDAVIGSIARQWQTSLTSTRISYDRTQSSTLLDLALAPIPELGIEDEFSVRVQGVTLNDTVTLVHSTQRLCDLCTLNFIVRGSEEENVQTGEETWEYLAGAGLGLAVAEDKTVDFDYRWQGDALEESSTIDDERHQFTVTYRHRLTELASWGAAFDTAFTRGLTDQDRYQARVFFTLGWDGMERAW